MSSWASWLVGGEEEADPNQAQEALPEVQEGEIVPCIIEGLPSPVTVDDYEALHADWEKKAIELMTGEEGWEDSGYYNASAEDMQLKMWDRAVEGVSIYCLKCTCVMPVSIATMHKRISSADADELRNWDPDVETTKIHAAIKEDIELVYQSYAAPFPVASRNFLAVRYTRRDGETVTITGGSINHADYPMDPNYCRGVLHVGGWRLEPIEGEPNKCQVVRVIQVDPCGMIPGWIVNMFKSKAAQALVDLRDMMVRFGDVEGIPAE
eukprot:TRINITY_DN359_c0_g1_i1.p1 TRINITY_DN359_c0_g1~~TRINITY_DN359_c0_g1_i1.p1  ORF type:complete len:266 (-),score=68.76 TRINITY_DN359_c0_g1_i1:142-939(-)